MATRNSEHLLPPTSVVPTAPEERQDLARGERFLRTPGTCDYATNAPRQRQGRGEIRQPLPGAYRYSYSIRGFASLTPG